MKRAFIILAAVLVVATLGGCDLLFGSDVPIRAWNGNSWIAVVQYRESGTTTWQTAIGLLSDGYAEAEVFTLPSGTYDFRMYDWVSDGVSYFDDIIYSQDVEYLGDGDYDYTLYLDSYGELDFYD